MKAVGVVLFYGALLSLAYIQQDPILQWLHNGERGEWPLALALATFLAFVPVVPFGVVGGIMGAKYGPLLGGFINTASSTAAAVLMFLFVRYAFREQGRVYLSRFKQLERFTVLFERNPFMSILFARLIPFIPAAAVNIYSAISRTPLITFFTATLMGKVPVMLVFALVGDQMFTSAARTLTVVLIYGAFLAVVYGGYRLWHKTNNATS
ncbi:VTT domain-containing protein [Paenibacillus sp. GD4]|uniref:TVP38/TMEM64 family protein n=1 Tax=Paenibacillus sp. GD4 TaxID=3068890 RepID=UPI002796A0F1|nr:VTT domain-containing protein [Paenibacillus sp. GD4]MDQ1910470.1 VTT domain-containing protein [Paenibacillus sp. GD4]